MDELELHIKSILAEWNPLAVPAGLAECEYSSYVQALVYAVKNKRNVRLVLLQMLERMGMEKPYNDDVIEDVSRISQQMKILECK